MPAPIEIKVPDIGGFADVEVIDVLVAAGQDIERDTPLITLETEKATMDVPSPQAGRIVALRVKKGDKVSEGSTVLTLEPAAAAAQAADQPATAAAAKPAPAAAPGPATTPVPAATPAPAPAPPAAAAPGPASTPAAGQPAGTGAPRVALPVIDEAGFSRAYASPSVRKFARELGVDLARVTGTGPKNRITHDDVKAWVKRALSMPAAAVAPAWPKVPEVDFAAFGPVEIRPLSRIQKISGPRLQASWVNLPHVTQHEEVDITELEVARTALKTKASQEGVKITPLAFIMRACVRALQEFPKFNSSLDSKGAGLVYKKYFNIGFAADTPNGLVVPVIAGADRLGVIDIARQLGVLSEKARAGKLTPGDMQGGTFTISSLGGIGGTAFTPIINAPEVAILGVSRSAMKPVFQNGAFLPRLMLPLSLSYDHRVVDGADAARFVVYLGKILADAKALM
ncbi:MAG: 2-oxo acid dehydrogenase subunit E2 [Steroidobacteraceae bacterium]